jgi:hypothetical protein
MPSSKSRRGGIYLHLTQKGQEDACQLINQVMEGLDHDHNQ